MGARNSTFLKRDLSEPTNKSQHQVCVRALIPCRFTWKDRTRGPYDWARRFEDAVKAQILSGDFKTVARYESLGVDAALSVPTPEHFYPLLYVLGCSTEGEAVSFPIEGFEGGSVSMLSVKIG
jgi:4,5-DOPA dioxygenase extradiol